MNRTWPYLTALAAGAVTAVVTVVTWSFVHTLFSPWVLAPAVFPMAVLGGLAGLLWMAVPMKPLMSYAVGAAAGLLWIPLFLQGFPNPPVAVLAGAVVAWSLAGRIMAAALAGIPRHTIRRDHLELLLVRTIRGAGLIFFVSIVLFPFLFMISTSFKSRAEYLRDPVNLAFNVLQPPAQLFNGYIEVLTRFSFGRYIFNSTIIALFTVVLTLIPAILGAYAVTRLTFPGRRMLSKLILLIYMFPAIVLVIPLYSVFTQLGLRDTRHGLLIVYAAMTIPVALYMLRSYFQTLPKDLEEAGLIDGLSRFGVILRITLPLSLPAIASVGLYVFMIAWNEFLFAFMFLDTPAIFTLSRGMIMLDDQEVPRQFLMAGATVITVPIMFLFFRFQRLLVGGLTAGGVKG